MSIMPPVNKARQMRDAAAVREAFEEGNTSELVRNKVYMFAEDVSIVGARYVFDAERTPLQRIVWAALVLASMSIAIYQIQDRFGFYGTYPTSSGANIVQNASLSFPQITICNQNTFSRKTAQKYGTVGVL